MVPAGLFVADKHIPVFYTLAAEKNLNGQKKQNIPQKPISRDPVMILRCTFPASERRLFHIIHIQKIKFTGRSKPWY
jgi:hypothetical protein